MSLGFSILPKDAARYSECMTKGLVPLSLVRCSHVDLRTLTYVVLGNHWQSTFSIIYLGCVAASLSKKRKLCCFKDKKWFANRLYNKKSNVSLSIVLIKRCKKWIWRKTVDCWVSFPAIKHILWVFPVRVYLYLYLCTIHWNNFLNDHKPFDNYSHVLQSCSRIHNYRSF